MVCLDDYDVQCSCGRWAKNEITTKVKKKKVKRARTYRENDCFESA